MLYTTHLLHWGLFPYQKWKEHLCTDSDPFVSWHPEEARKWYAKSWKKKFRQKFKFWIFPKNSNTRHTSWSWLVRCVDLKWNLANILGDTERARFGLQTDGRTDGQTDGRTKWNQYTPLNFVGEGYMLSLKNMERNSRQKLSFHFGVWKFDAREQKATISDAYLMGIVQED